MRTQAKKEEGKVFKDYDEMLHAYYNGDVGIHAKVKVRKKFDESERGVLVESTVEDLFQ